MSILDIAQEKLYLPLRAAWAAKNGLSAKEVAQYTQHLLHDMDTLPPLKTNMAVILGSTRATAFAVNAALNAGHQTFLLIGGKPIVNEHPAFTAYVEKGLTVSEREIANLYPEQTESDYARELLLEAGIAQSKILWVDKDRSTNTGANMRALIAGGYGHHKAMEFYTLAGFARRAFMTARKELGDLPVISVHNAYPRDVTADNWSSDPVACAHMAGEAAKALGENPLYVRRGYATTLDLAEETTRIKYYNRQMMRGPSL